MGLLTVLAFAGLAVLLCVAWLRMRARDQATLNEWEACEAELEGEPDVFNWEEHVEDPDAWKGGSDDSEP